MKRVAITFLVFLFFTAITIYILAYQSPLKMSVVLQISQEQAIYTDNSFIYNIPGFIDNGLIWSLLDPLRFYPWLLVLSGAVISLVASVHMLIDKLFFRKFFEQPAIFPAIRRGVWVALILLAAIFLRLIDGLIWYNLISVILLFTCLEVLILNIQHSSKRAKKDK